MYNYVETRSPSESSKVAFIWKNKNEYKGMIKIVSASGTFTVLSSGIKPREVLENLHAQFLSKMDYWSSVRHF